MDTNYQQNMERVCIVQVLRKNNLHKWMRLRSKHKIIKNKNESK